MKGLTLVHVGTVNVRGEEYAVNVFCRDDGRHFAKTSFTAADIIINDGATLDEVLNRHRELLPLAISSRKMRTEMSTLCAGTTEIDA
jgi:hypothetical protein